MEKLKDLKEKSGGSLCCRPDCCGSAKEDPILLHLPFDIPIKVFKKIINRKEVQNGNSR